MNTCIIIITIPYDQLHYHTFEIGYDLFDPSATSATKLVWLSSAMQDIPLYRKLYQWDLSMFTSIAKLPPSTQEIVSIVGRLMILNPKLVPMPIRLFITRS